MSEQQAQYEGYAIVEIMGRQRVAGFVTTKYDDDPEEGEF